MNSQGFKHTYSPLAIPNQLKVEGQEAVESVLCQLALLFYFRLSALCFALASE